MSEPEDDIRIVSDPTITDPFGIRLVSIPQSRSKHDEQEWDDTGESLFHMKEQEHRDHTDKIPLDWIMPW